MPEIHIGTCGFRGKQSAFFAQYRLAEVQKTFYQPPELTTAERWH